jgi:hypothetical protein
MMQTIKTYCLVICFLAISGCLPAQNLKSDLKRMYQSYINLKNFSMDIVVKVYKHKEDNNPAMVLNGFIKRNNDQYYAYIDNNEVMVNKDYTVYTDKVKKMIIYRDNKENRGKKLANITYGPEEMSKMIDSMVNKSDTVKYIGTVGQDREYYIASSKHLVQIADVLIDTSTSIINKVTYYYNSTKMKTNNKVQIEFKNVDANLTENQNDYNLSRYLVDANGAKVAAAKYKGYRVFKDTKKGLN